MNRPNILFIQTDQHLATTLGCYGSTLCDTPHIDALAAEGLLFHNAYASSPICTPARASLHTGLYPSKHGLQTNIYTPGCMIHELPDHPSLLGRRLGQLGYKAGFTGKWHLGFGDDRRNQEEYQAHIRAVPTLDWQNLDGALPSRRGFVGDDFPGHGGIGIDTPQYKAYLAERGLTLNLKRWLNEYPYNWEILSGKESSVSYFLTEQALSHIAGFCDQDAPFCYLLNFWGPHGPYHAPTEYLDRYRDLKIPQWASWDEEQSGKPSIHNAHRTETTMDWKWEAFQNLIRTYFAAVTEIDDQVGRLVAFLKKRGVYDNTLIIFCADHGDSLGVHKGLTDKSLFMYEETNRIPLILRAPAGDDAHRGEVEDRFVGTCDLYSTILDFAGLPPGDANLDGCSLRPLIEGTPVAWRDEIVTEASGIDFLAYSQRALRWSHFKYVFNAGGPDELYDLGKDPYEMRNLVQEKPELLREGRQRLDAWMERQDDGLLERFRRLTCERDQQPLRDQP